MTIDADAPPQEQTLDEMLGQPAPRPKRRLRSLTINREEIAKRVVDFYTDDMAGRSADRDRRIQRYAKFRMWSEGKDWPWVGASDLGLPDLMEKSQRVQDTLCNAVLGSRPNVIGAQATLKANKEKEDTIDQLIDYQFFVECKGEFKIGQLAEAYVNDGVFTTFVPWVKEKRDVCERSEYPYPDETQDFFDYLQSIVVEMYPEAVDLYPMSEPDDPGADGWNWCVVPTEGEKVTVSFFTEDNDNDEPDVIFAQVKKYVVTHDGPVVIPLDYDDVLYPAGVENLQIPGPSNPGGSPHVILRSSPTIDEVKRQAAIGYYDLLTPEDIERLQPQAAPASDEVKKHALNTIQGQASPGEPKDKSQGTVTRLLCFDRYDLDGDGLAEDVIFWVLLEPKLVCRARYLTEEFPARVPRRPLASPPPFLPASGRREGISLLEQQEGIHDAMKMLYDITQDSGVLGALPIFFYRMAGALKPETLNLFPGMGIPVGDPQRDVNFPNVANPNALGMLLNLISMLGTWGDRSTMIGEFQLGRVPAGKSSALRTTGSVSMLQAQGDARPERLLRGFFSGIAEIWSIIHDLNCAFLPKDKQIRVSGLKSPHEDPFMTIEGRNKIDGQFEFSFNANAFNTSKAMMQQSLMQLAGAYFSPLFVQAGIVKPDNIYALGRDLGKAFGVDVNKYLTAPSPEADLPPITAPDAITAIMANQMPYGRPAEGSQAHLEALAQFFQSDEFGMLTPKQTEAFGAYAKQVMERLMGEQMQAMMAQAAAQYQQGGQGQPGGDPGGAPTQNAPPDPNAPPPQVSGGGELMDETLPGAGGGGQPEQGMAA